MYPSLAQQSPRSLKTYNESFEKRLNVQLSKRENRAKRLRQATHDPYRTSVPHSSLMGGRIRTT